MAGEETKRSPQDSRDWAAPTLLVRGLKDKEEEKLLRRPANGVEGEPSERRRSGRQGRGANGGR